MAAIRELPAPQMVIETHGATKREGIEPQANLGQLNSHRVDVHAVDAPLQDVAVRRLMSVNLAGSIVTPCSPIDSRMLGTGAVQGESDRIDWELVKEVQQAVGHQNDHFDQEVAAPHCRIENLEIEQSTDQVIMDRIGFGRSPLAMIHLAAADLLGGVCFRFLHSLSKLLALRALKQPRPMVYSK